MISYSQIYSLWSSGALHNKTVVAVGLAALSILSEDPLTVNHANRLIWAKQALKDPSTKAQELMWCVVGNGDVQSAGDEAADSLVQYVVDVSIDIFATGA